MRYISGANTKPVKKRKIGRIIGRAAIVFLVIIAFLVVLFLGAMWIIIDGPSKTARDIFVTTCMETSFARLFPPLYLSDSEIHQIQLSNSVVASDDVTNTETTIVPVEKDADIEPIVVEEVSGATFKGKMMIVSDPSRVRVACSQSIGTEESSGERLDVMIKNSKAVAGINAGGFEDENGMGNGGVPLGIVVKDGKFIYGDHYTAVNVIGLDKNNVLHVGTMSAAQVRERGIRDAVSFGPSLIVNSKPMKTVGSSGGLNPRTAIGQRADGTILLLVIDGRQPHSLGATFKDLVDVMLKYEAVNAGNLDGGSSTIMYYNGEIINSCVSIYGPRKIPTGFIVV